MSSRPPHFKGSTTVVLDDQGKPYGLVGVEVADTYYAETIAQMFDYHKSNRQLTQHALIDSKTSVNSVEPSTEWSTSSEAVVELEVKYWMKEGST